MVSDLVGLLLEIENAYESVKLNLDAISWVQSCLGSHSMDQNVLIHLNYLCELNAENELRSMKAAIVGLKQRLTEPPESPLPPPVNLPQA